MAAAPVTYFCANAAASHQTWSCWVYWQVALISVPEAYVKRIEKTFGSVVINIDLGSREVLKHFCRFFGMTAKTMITGELSLQEHLEKAWGGSYSCLDSGQHSHTLTQWTTLSIGAQASYSRAIPVFLPVSSHLRPLCSLSVVTQNNIVIQSSFILKEYKMYETNIYVSGMHGLTNLKLKH